MSEGGALSFESVAGVLSLLGRHDSLAAASAALPDGAYTTLRTYGGNSVVRLDQHLARLEESLALKGTPERIDPAAVRAALGKALKGSGNAESRVRLTLAPPRLFIAVEAFAPLPEWLYTEGAACATLELERANPRAKDTRFIATAQEAYERLPEGVEEGLLVAPDGAVLEGLSSNFFAIHRGALRTEEARALAGVTRSLALEVAEALLPIWRVAVKRDELPRVDEAFITSVSREVLPVVRIDGRPTARGRVGAHTRAIMQGFAALVARERETL